MMKRLTVLAGDVGATKTLLAVFNFDGDKLCVLHKEKFITSDCRDFENTIKKFLANDKMPDIICLCVAGPVMDGKVNITNISLSLNSEQLSAALKNTPVYIINDLEATAYGLSEVKTGELQTIFEGKQNAKGNIAVIAPGTGLGEAAAYWDGTKHHPFATEGGHCDFAVRTQTDFELFNYLNKKYNHVSWERLVSGQGIINIFEFLKTKKQMEIPGWLQEQLNNNDTATVISSNTQQVEACKETMQLFFRYLATESAQLALKTKATGGLFIGGGIIPKVLRLLDSNLFIQYFTDFGRLKFLLETIPVKIILNEKTALLGAAVFGAGLLKI